MSPAEQPERIESEPRTQQVIHGGAGNVDKIRDILFGSQMRDYEVRFARLEETVAKENNEIRETNRRRFDQLEAYIQKEFEALQNRLRVERDERTDGSGQHARELKEVGESLNRRLRDLDDRSTQMERDLRAQLLNNSRELHDEIRGRYDEVATLLEKRFHELREGKTDRAALATLFTEVALRLNDQFQIPGSEG